MHLPLKPTLVLLTLLVLFAIPDHLEYFKDYKVMDWQGIAGVLDFVPRNQPSATVQDEELRLHPERDAASFKIFRLSQSEGALDHFFEALWRAETREPGTVCRIVHYGDSPTTADLITGDSRRLLQKQFGDAGHGFLLIEKPWAWYDHFGVAIRSSGFAVESSTMSRTRDGYYGLGGVSFRGGAGSVARWTFQHPGHTSVEVSYFGQPGGGTVSVLADGRIIGNIQTDSASPGSGFERLPVPSLARTFELRPNGPVRLFGAVFFKPGPGVVYDSIGLNGASVNVLSRVFDGKHWTEQLRHANPDLVIINYGTNESGYMQYIDQYYTRELKEIIRRVRAATPQASILVMSPMDRGRRETGGDIGTMPGIPKLVAIQQQVALENGCGFFNTYLAMGGPGTMGRWYQAEPRLVGGDFIHPMPAGARIVGTLLYQALLDGFNRYKIQHMQQRFAQALPERPAERQVRR